MKKDEKENGIFGIIRNSVFVNYNFYRLWGKYYPR